jgi:2-polyprenyl-3-methyl-5-hydroxy-6-metoxy-1,4-benzoquinol methylase
MYDTEAEAKACSTGDMQLVEDQQTGLVYNTVFRPELMTYDDHYQNEQALSPLFQEYIKSASRIIDRCMGRDSIVEVGCGKGFFLEMLLAKVFNVAGFDPIAIRGVTDKLKKIPSTHE